MSNLGDLPSVDIHTVQFHPITTPISQPPISLSTYTQQRSFSVIIKSVMSNTLYLIQSRTSQATRSHWLLCQTLPERMDGGYAAVKRTVGEPVKEKWTDQDFMNSVRCQPIRNHRVDQVPHKVLAVVIRCNQDLVHTEHVALIYINAKLNLNVHNLNTLGVQVKSRKSGGTSRPRRSPFWWQISGLFSPVPNIRWYYIFSDIKRPAHVDIGKTKLSCTVPRPMYVVLI